MSTEVHEETHGATSVPGSGEGCPPPLMWQEVVRNVDAGVRSRLIRGAGGEWGVREIGQGRPVVVLGGFVGSSRLYSLLAWLLRDEYRCLLVEYPRKRWWSRGLRLVEYGAGLREVLKASGASEAIVMGVSFGAEVALECVRGGGSAVRGLVLLPTYHGRRWTVRERGLAALGSWLPGMVKRLPGMTKVLENNERRWFPPFDASRWNFCVEEVGGTRIAELCQRVRSVQKQPDVSGEIGGRSGSGVRMLLLGTEGEGKLGERSRESLKREFPESEMETMALVGSLVGLTHPHRLRTMLRSFLEGEK